MMSDIQVYCSRTIKPVTLMVAESLVITAPDQVILRSSDGLIIIGQFSSIMPLKDSWLVSFAKTVPTMLVRYGKNKETGNELNHLDCFSYVVNNLEDTQIYFGSDTCKASRAENAESAFGLTNHIKVERVGKSVR